MSDLREDLARAIDDAMDDGAVASVIADAALALIWPRAMEMAAAKMLGLRAVNAANLGRNGAEWEVYDQAILEAHTAIRNMEAPK